MKTSYMQLEIPKAWSEFQNPEDFQKIMDHREEFRAANRGWLPNVPEPRLGTIMEKVVEAVICNTEPSIVDEVHFRIRELYPDTWPMQNHCRVAQHIYGLVACGLISSTGCYREGTIFGGMQEEFFFERPFSPTQLAAAIARMKQQRSEDELNWERAYNAGCKIPREYDSLHPKYRAHHLNIALLASKEETMLGLQREMLLRGEIAVLKGKRTVDLPGIGIVPESQSMMVVSQ